MQLRQPPELEATNRRGDACSDVAALSLPFLPQLLLSLLLLLMRIVGAIVVVVDNVRNAALHVNGIELHILGAAFVLTAVVVAHAAVAVVVLVTLLVWLRRIVATANGVARCSFAKSIVRCFVVVVVIVACTTL